MAPVQTRARPEVSQPAAGMSPLYRRIVLKLSGEALMGNESAGIHVQTMERVAHEVQRVSALGTQIAIVVGGGNIVRGMDVGQRGLDRVTGDYMGMLATVINSLALRDALEQRGMQCRLQTAIAMQQIAEPFIPRRTMRHLEKGRVVILAGGNGNPFFTTDTTAALRAAEIDADVLLKTTKVDGIYSSDPKLDADAMRYHHLSYMDVISRGLGVMDSTALTLCMENRMPIVVFDLGQEGNIERVVMGEKVGTLVDNKGTDGG